MSKTNDGGPAFPESYIGTDAPHEGLGGGMTLRDYFAAHAPPKPDGWEDDQLVQEDHASWAYAYADAMLRAREETR